MQGSALIVGKHYIVNDKFTGSGDLRSGDTRSLRKGDILVCIQTPRSGGWNRSERSSIFHKLSGPTNVTWSFYNHKGLDPYDSGVTNKGINREQEKKTLSALITNWKRSEEELQSQLSDTRSKIEEGQRRLNNLEKYDSDEEALADIMLRAKTEEIGKKELVQLIRDAGISL